MILWEVFVVVEEGGETGHVFEWSGLMAERYAGKVGERLYFCIGFGGRLDFEDG